MKAVWTSRLGSIARDQLPYALSQALNETAREAAAEARVEAGKRLNIRKRSLLTAFIRAPLDQKATKRKLSARVMVGGPKSDPTRGSILTQHEQSGVKLPFRGRFVAVPGRDIMKPGSKRDIIRGTELKNFRPFVTNGNRTTGAKRTFIVKDSGTGFPVLLQRQARRVRVLWLFVRQSRLTGKLGFSKAVQRVVGKNLTKNIGRSLTQAIATAKEVKSGGGVTSTRL